MGAEGMVHALHQIYDHLKPGCYLIDIHPSGDPPPIDVRLGQQVHRVGWINEEDDYIEYTQADEALAEAVRRGWYKVNQAERFAFTTYADTMAELLAHLANTWPDARVAERTSQQVCDLLNSIEPDREIIVREWIKITCLEKVARP